MKRKEIQAMLKKFFFLSFLLFSNSILYGQPQIRISKASWHFGSVTEGEILKESLIIKNSGNERLNIKIRSSCDCIDISFSKINIKPSRQATLKITYDTKGEAGRKTQYLFLDSNDSEHPHLTWVIEGEIVKNLASVTVYMFSSPGCHYCIKLKKKFIPKIEKKYNIKINLVEYLISEPENYERLILMEKEYGDTDNKMPVLFIGNKVLGGKKEINRNLEKELLMYRATREKIKIKKAELEREITKKFESIKVLPVLGAGLIDGLNPCAFGAIIFLISYLSMIMKKKKKEIFFTGMSFTLGVFVAYFLLGLGLARILYLIEGFTFAVKFLYILIGLLTLILAVLSFKDYLVIRNIQLDAKSGGSITLKIPDSFRWKMFKVFEKHTKMKYFIIFAFFTGIIISGLELICTGQIYLPTIMYMIQATAERSQAIGYLFLYSLMFIIPLLLVFFLFYLGVNSEKIDVFGQKHFKTVKLLNTLVFFFFFVYMLKVVFTIF